MLKKILLILVLIATHTSLNHATTLVYNLRIRRSFNLPFALKEQKKARILASAIPIFYARKSHIVDATKYLDIDEKRRVGGALFNVRYIPSKHWWLEVTTGLETEHSNFRGSDSFNAARTGLDDIVFAGGYRHFIGQNTQIVGYGIFGTPTQRSVSLDDRYGPLVGSRFFNLGFGAEGSYAFITKPDFGLTGVLQQRFIHGFDRSWFPILPKCSIIQPGNFTDLLGTLQFRKNFTGIEVGYNPTFFTNQAIISPTKQKISADTFIRHGGYISVAHLILNTTFDKPMVIGAGCNISGSKKFDARTFSTWLNISVVF